MRIARSAVLVFGMFFTICGMANAAETSVPEPFQGHDENSQYSIDYSDLSAILKAVVVDTGRSTRRTATEADDLTGTRVKAKIKKTANEANRFYYETFEDDDEAAAFLKEIQLSLEALPSEAPLEHFSRDEQLAYWLNLYNVTVLNEVIAVYPRNNLKKYVTGKNSIFSRKLLEVAGIPLSLDDIQYTILKQNYDNDPLIMYGLYKGIIGGPNIRKTAYTGSDVYRALKNNAIEFVNSNRGTYIHSEKTFRVSSLYERNKVYFPDFESDLSAHLLDFIEGEERSALQTARKIKANIDDWAVTDLGGTHRRVGGSLADSRAALMDSVKSTVPADGGGVTGAAVGAGSSFMAAKGRQLSLARIDPSLLEVLQDIDEKRLSENQRKSSVDIEELDSSPDDANTETSTDPEQNQ